MVRLEYRALRVLDFDVEARPIAWYGGDNVTRQITCIAWQWVGKPGVKVSAIGESDRMSKVLEEEEAMLRTFVAEYEKADLVVGHFIRDFDLPLINGSLMRLGLPGLAPRLTQDTCRDLRRRNGMSASQENLAAMWELQHPKVGMNTAKWSEANMLLPEGIRKAKHRVTGDVRQNIELRQRMIDGDYIKAPRVWRP